MIKIEGYKSVCRIPDGWDWRFVDSGRVVCIHADHPPRCFDTVTEVWSEITPDGLKVLYDLKILEPKL